MKVARRLWLGLALGVVVATGAGRARGADGVAGQVVVVEPSAGEEFSRRLLELRSARQAAAKQAGPNDPAVAELDRKIASMQARMLERTQPNAAEDMTVVPKGVAAYPRIVTAEQAPAATAGAAAANSASAGGAANGGLFQGASREDLEARAKLEQVVAALEFKKMPLEKFIDKLHEEGRISVHVNWAALQAAAIERSTEISLQLLNTTWRTALATALLDAGGNNASPGWLIDEGVLTISTKEDLNSSKYQAVRFYDIRDFASFQKLEQYPLNVQMVMRQDLVTSLTDTIKASIAPDSWRDAGGTVGSIRELNGILIVNQTGDNHLAIQGFMEKLRAAKW